jgi:hypothetical protein
VNACVSIIRFGRAEAGCTDASGAELVSQVFLHDLAAASGRIVQIAGRWVYLLADGSSSGLASTQSRGDLEQQIIVFHFGPPENGEPC